MPSPEPAPRGPAPDHGGPHSVTWTALCAEPLPSDVGRWARRADCGAVVTFEGVVRNHAEGRDGVESLTYEAYEEVAAARLDEIAAAAREQWPAIGRLAMLHRVGTLEVGEPSVVVAVGAPHRDVAFEAARWCIDTIKVSLPVWKHERWSSGSGWGTGSHDLTPVVAHRVGDRS